MRIYVEGISYNVEAEGKADGAPVILLHGFTGDHTTWHYLRKALEKSFYVISIDLLGHGQTDAPMDPKRYEMDQAAKDIIYIMNELRIPKAHLLGYSMGGRLALGIAVMYPERLNSLMLESTSPGLKTESEKLARIRNDETLAKRILGEGIINFVDFWENIPLFQTQKRLPDHIKNEIRTQRLQNTPIGLANSLIGFSTGKQPSLWGELSSMSIPVLIMYGELDQKFCTIAKEMNELVPGAELVKFQHAGHAIHVEVPEKFVTIVMEFLYELEHIS
ncbi:2-succinyl-6-hydroxy-2,4-cyclohexadiene-1-carboxylate synthase [Siminovitchia sediminis]|uniref:Putative 2-succinyl-6-hydroxy-2,4-cyclohexadiene-1-carboxylate synthase n=1 Tax=Siminovitchia sediminis TaxID=1274353 RepID=A0ABW4KHT5_9BACI